MFTRFVIVCFVIVGISFFGAVQQVVPQTKEEVKAKEAEASDAKAREDKIIIEEKAKEEKAKEDKAKAKADADRKLAELPKDPIKAAEKTLQDSKIGIDPKSLLEFFRSRTLNDDDRLRLLTTIRRLGHDDFDTREKASEELTMAGLAALPILRTASRDPNVEVARRIENCLHTIQQEQETSRIIAAAKLLAHQKVDGTVGTLLAYLPSIPDDEVVADGLRDALIAYTKSVGKADPLLERALEDTDPSKRALAVQVIGEALPGEREKVRKRFVDPDAKVRYLASSTLAKVGDAQALPALLKLIGEGPIEFAFQVEDLLCQLLDPEEKPPATLNGNDGESRKKVQDAWEKWIAAKGEKLKLARLNEGEPLRGLTLIMEVDGGGVNGGRIWECGPDGKQRWEIANAGGPVDVQVLPGGRLLIPEYYTSRVTERNHEGKILWESPRLNGNSVSAQRLPNGNTLIATNTEVVEYNRAKEKVATFPQPGGSVFQAIRHRNGHTFILAGNALFEYNIDKKEVRNINVGTISGWAGFEILPNGNFLIAFYSQNNKYAEINAAGKTVWEHSTTNSPTRLDPTRVQRLRNGNTLVAGGNVAFVVEFDRDKKEIWKVATKGRPFGVRRY